MTIQKLLLILAVIAFVVLGIMGAGWIDESHPEAWLAFGLALFAGGHIS
jgi:hypothetical protein